VYLGAVLPEGENPPGGQHFLDAMLDGKGAELLEKYGFGPPPG
jgi:ABC-type molybdate transport system substrate-binding protein